MGFAFFSLEWGEAVIFNWNNFHTYWMKRNERKMKMKKKLDYCVRVNSFQFLIKIALTNQPYTNDLHWARFFGPFLYLFAVWHREWESESESLWAAVVFDVKNSIKVKVLKNHLVCDILCAPPNYCVVRCHGAMWMCCSAVWCGLVSDGGKSN